MANRKLGNIILVMLFVGFAAGAYGQVTVSGGFALSSMKLEQPGYSVSSEVGIGGNVYVDYLLPIGVPLSLGGEVGIDSSTFRDGDYTASVQAIPLLARIAYHFDLFPKLDLYLVGKIGYVIGISSDLEDEAGTAGSSLTIGGAGFGFDAGAAYYFSPLIGVFAEAGFDRYALKAKLSGGGNNISIDAPFSRFFTVGLSFKR
jgi:hypothetical protein